MSLRKRPVTLLDFIGKEKPPRGWKALPQNIYILGFHEYPMIPLKKEYSKSKYVKEAYKFFYPGFQEDQYLHLVSLDPFPLNVIFAQLMMSSQISGDYWDRVRLTVGYVNKKRTLVVPSSFDSRTLYPTASPKDVDMKRCPYAVRLLPTETFRKLVNEDIDCFIKPLLPPSQWDLLT